MNNGSQETAREMSDVDLFGRTKGSKKVSCIKFYGA
jgi:hypothetical protein